MVTHTVSQRLRGECRECEDGDEHGEGSLGNDLWTILRASLFYSPLENPPRGRGDITNP